jgi:hypothetical protein
LALADEVPHSDEVFIVPMVASPQPDRQDGLDLGKFLSMVGPHVIGEPSEADGFDSRVSLGKALGGTIVETGDSWEPYALTAHVRF